MAAPMKRKINRLVNRLKDCNLCCKQLFVVFFIELTGAAGFSELSELADLSEFGEIRRTCG